MSKFNSSTEDVPRRRRQQAGRWPETIGRPMKFLMTRPQFSPQFPEFSQKNKLKIHSRLSMAAPVSLLFHPRWLKSLPFDIRSRSSSRGLARMCFAAALARHSLLHTALWNHVKSVRMGRSTFRPKCTSSVGDTWELDRYFIYNKLWIIP